MLIAGVVSGRSEGAGSSAIVKMVGAVGGRFLVDPWEVLEIALDA